MAGPIDSKDFENGSHDVEKVWPLIEAEVKHGCPCFIDDAIELPKMKEGLRIIARVRVFAGSDEVRLSLHWSSAFGRPIGSGCARSSFPKR